MAATPLETELAALAARVAELERRLAELAPAPAAPPPPPPPPPTGSPTTIPPGVAPPPTGSPTTIPSPPPPPPAGPVGPAGQPPPVSAPWWQRPSTGPGAQREGGPEAWWPSTEGLLKWAGVVLVVLAAIFFVATAISRGWIGPEVQLAGAALIGLALLAGGHRLAPTRRPWAVALASGGAVVLPICAGATSAALDLLDRYPALVLLAVVTVGLLAFAARLSMEAVASVALVTAQLVVVWIVGEADDVPALIPGLALVLAAVLAAGFDRWRAWPICRIVGAATAAFLLFTLVASEGDQLVGWERAVAVVGLVVVAAIGWFGPILAAEPGAGSRSWRRGLDHRLVLGVPLWTWAVTSISLDLTDTPAFGRVGLVNAAVFAALTGGLALRLPRTLVAAQVVGVATLAAAAAASLIEGPGLLLALTGIAVGSAVLAWLLGDWLLTIYAAVLTVVVVAWTAGLVLASLFERRSWGETAATAVVIALAVGAAILADRTPRAGLASALIGGSWVAGLLWLAGVVVHGPQGQVVVSLLWAAAAVIALVIGVIAGRRTFRVLGLGTLAVVLTKLLTIDLASVDTLWRVGLFLVIGAGLLRLGFVLPRLSARDDPGPGQ